MTSTQVKEGDHNNNNQDWSSYAKDYAAPPHQNLDVPRPFNHLAAWLLFDEEPNGPVTFLDVAAGPGTLTMAILQHWQECQWSPKANSKIIVTDYAPGMVTQANNRILDMEVLKNWHGQLVTEFQVMNALEPSVPVSSITHLGCIFGIMFVPNHTVAFQRLYNTLALNGKALFATWQKVDLMTLLREFGLFLGWSVEQLDQALKDGNDPLKICSDPLVFQKELEDAGFANVQVVEKTESFVWPVDPEVGLSPFAHNPVMSQCFPFLLQDKETLFPSWRSFLASEQGKHWVDATGQTMSLSWKANLGMGIRLT
eukprot:gene6194-6830_t